ncbi:MAG: EF-hand domain-containing protein [Alphaproteobacteria bacterium]
MPPTARERRRLSPIAMLTGLAAALLLTPFAGAPAAAGPADRDSALHWFDSVDTDHDGAFDAAEIERVRDKRFRRYDGNGDGYVTLDEFNFAVPEELADEVERRRRRFLVMDLDGDQRLTKDEYMLFGTRVIDAADSNGDGIVTRDEFADSVAPP